ncbi:hypothetical protein BCR44DRAFT_266749 [Catenaria anguillulae PL171]|uniref:Uncharacterized protein n=1 Tax=Catenaria anguillulae PL171 TaxID=765915 RepID=A0A1Y2HBY1_9FUNG|nr:hypothetical protein BCR44DRAFT_266749 [Catenaria anguillulae PL171]
MHDSRNTQLQQARSHNKQHSRTSCKHPSQQPVSSLPFDFLPVLAAYHEAFKQYHHASATIPSVPQVNALMSRKDPAIPPRYHYSDRLYFFRHSRGPRWLRPWGARGFRAARHGVEKMLRPLIRECSGWKPNKTAGDDPGQSNFPRLAALLSLVYTVANSLPTHLYPLNEPQAATVYKAVHNKFADGFRQPSHSCRALEHLRAQ